MKRFVKKLDTLSIIRLIFLWFFVFMWMVVILHGPRGVSNNAVILESFPALFQVGPSIVKLLLSPSFQWSFFISTLALVAILGLTALFGRWYCSCLCPMGTLQDFSLWIGRKFGKKSFKFFNPQHALPWALLILIAYGLLNGNGVLYTLFEPYGVAIRPFILAFEPLARNLSSSYFGHDVRSLSFSILSLSWVWLIVMLILAVLRGRFFCRHFCPVGAILEVCSKRNKWKLWIDSSGCVKCGKCESLCRASCIDSSRNYIDNRRCILCFDCVSCCPVGAVSYLKISEDMFGSGSQATDYAVRGITNKVEKSGYDRRKFLKMFPTVCLGAAWLFIESGIRSNVGNVSGIRLGSYERPVAFPPGAESLRRLMSRCVGCGLCEIVCPSGVIEISAMALRFNHPALPVMNYSRGYCQYECRRCMVVCPTGALRLFSLEEKKSIRVGLSRFVRGRCIMVRQGKPCGACAEHCPTGAISLEVVSRGRGRRGNMPEPVINESLCVGCGACETVCPAKPAKAIYVEGLGIHEKISFSDRVSPKPSESTRDFPF